MALPRRAIASALALLVATTGCAGSDSTAAPAASTATSGATEPAPAPTPTSAPTPAPADPTATPTPTPPPGSAGCAAASPSAASVEERTLTTTDGLERTYRLALPDAVAGTPLPLVLDFHGLTSTSEQQALISGWEADAANLGAIVVHPQGTTSPQGLPYWNLQSGLDEGVDDVAFTNELLDALEAELCVDPTRVYSTGLSNGGYFSALLACRMADRIAAIATVAAIMHSDDCEPSRPVPVLAFHGTDDPIVPFEGGESSLTAEGGLLDSSEASPELAAFFAMKMPEEVGEWAAESSCASEPTVEAVSETVERRVYEGCTGGSAVEFYVVNGGGHTWPGSAVMAAVEDFVGPTTFDVDATELSWDFFSQHVIAP